MKTRIFGLFDRTGRVADLLKPGSKTLTAQGPVFQEGYLAACEEGIRLWTNCRLYNIDEIIKFTGYPGSGIARQMLVLYRQEGIRGFRRLNGRFTIIIQENDKTVIVRDRNGEGRQIFYTPVFFTDSFSALKEIKGFYPVPDLQNLSVFLSLGYIPSPRTSLENVSKLPAGGVLTVTSKGVMLDELFSYNMISSINRNPLQMEEAVDNYEKLLKQSLLRRVGNSTSAGLLLSGGYDSGGNLATLREVFSGQINTYSVGFWENCASELPYARQMAEHFGAVHHEYTIDGSEIEWLPSMVDALGDPFAESGVMLNYAALKMIKNDDPSVVIGGDANDQYFGAGIRETAMHYQISRYGLIPLAKLFEKISDNRFFDHDNLAFRLQYQNRKILRVMEPETFGFYNFQLRKMFMPKDLETPHGITGKFTDFDDLFLKRNFFLHLRQTTNDVIINKAGRISDYFDINLTFSYTDLDLYHFIQNLPIGLRAKGSIGEYIFGKGVSKYIHKQLIRPKLPKEVTCRCKQGGFSPLELFFRDEKRRKTIFNYISRSDFARNIMDKNFLSDFFAKYEKLITSKPYWFWYRQVKSGQMFNLLVLTIWWDRVIRKKRLSVLSDYLE